MAISVLLYGAEIWALTMQQMKRVEAAEMKLLRPSRSYTLLHDKHKRFAKNLMLQIS
jgi:hypothetical protein